VALDQEAMEKLFGCSGRVDAPAEIPELAARRLEAEAQRHAKATISMSLDRNSVHFGLAREKLEKWADDMVLATEKALADTKEQIKVQRRQARQAVTLEEQHSIQEKIQKLERQQRRQRQEIFTVEDEIMEKRDSLIDQLERRLAQRTESQVLFNIRWRVV
jgi:predicted  nucleic acid-binding Zn-ribbon protein